MTCSEEVEDGAWDHLQCAVRRAWRALWQKELKNECLQEEM